MDNFIKLYEKNDNSHVSLFDKNLSKRYFVLNKNYEIILNKQDCKCIRLYNSQDEYDIDDAPAGSYYDSNENVWCIDMNEEEFQLFDETNEKYEYYKHIFAGEIIKALRYFRQYKMEVNLFDKHFY
jgi:hypothetical protein